MVTGTMNFRSINKFNVVVNTLSGNFLPLTETDTNIGLLCTIYIIFTWSVKLIYLSVTAIGLLAYTSTVGAIQKGGTNAISSLETLILTIYLRSHRENLCNLIRKINGIILDSNDFKGCLRDAVEPPKKRLKIYSVAAVGSVIIWAGIPVFKLLETNRFTYTDFTVAAYLPGAPFTVPVFLCGILIEIMGNIYIIIKKTGIDVYVSYFITLLTAEYCYVREQIVAAVGRKNGEKEEALVTDDLQKYSSQEKGNFSRIGENLSKLLSLNVGLTYLNCILRFCFLAFAIMTIPGAYFEKFLCLMYIAGNMIQVYMLCSCVQDLLDAVMSKHWSLFEQTTITSITDDAFHENWYGRGLDVKRIFRIIVMSNRMECRLTAFRIVDLTIPTFASIMNQAYTGCLLLLRFN